MGWREILLRERCLASTIKLVRFSTSDLLGGGEVGVEEAERGAEEAVKGSIA